MPKAKKEYGTLLRMVMSSTRETRHRSIFMALQQRLPALVFIIFLILYAATTAPSIVELFDDSLEFQLVLPTFGIAHPTGYPIYTLVGGLWSHLFPLGNWAWRVNLFSAIAAAGAVALVFALTLCLTVRDGRGDAWAATAAVIAFGFGAVWWSQATVAEVYTTHNLLVVGILALAVQAPSSREPGADRQMTLLFALIGLGLAHHRTTVLLLPGLAIYLLWAIPTIVRPRRVWLLWLVALLAPLLFYTYIPLRATQGVIDLNASYVNSWSGFWDHVLARRYTRFFVDNELTHGYDTWKWFALWREQTGWVGVGLSVLGLGVLTERERRPAWVLIVLVLATNLLFALNYRVGDPEVFLLPVFLCAAVLAGGGLALIRRKIRQRLAPPLHLLTLLSTAILLLLLIGNGRSGAVNRSADWAAHDYAVDMATVPFPENSRVIGIEGEMTALRYMQQAEQLGLAAMPIVANGVEERRRAVVKGMEDGVPIYLTRELEGIEAAYSFTGEGPLVRVWPRGAVEERKPSMRVDLPLLDERLLVEGYDVERLAWAGGPVVRVTLYWRPLTSIDHDLKVSLRVVNAADEPLFLRSGAPAVTDAYPLRQVARTTTWPQGVQVRDVYETPLPDGLADARLLIIMYDADTLAEIGRLYAPLP